MELLKLGLVLLLPLSQCFDSEVTLAKTIRRETDVTALCTNHSETLIDQIVCKMKRMGGEECRLLYKHGHGFIHECGSKFKLVTLNQTVFLHLSSLTREDGGNYSCECANLNGTFIHHLYITVEEKEEWNIFTGGIFIYAAVGAIVFITVTSVVLGLIWKLRRKQAEPASILPNGEVPDIEPYSTFKQTESGLYSVVRCEQLTN